MGRGGGGWLTLSEHCSWEILEPQTNWYWRMSDWWRWRGWTYVCGRPMSKEMMSGWDIRSSSVGSITRRLEGALGSLREEAFKEGERGDALTRKDRKLSDSSVNLGWSGRMIWMQQCRMPCEQPFDRIRSTGEDHAVLCKIKSKANSESF